MRLSAVVSSALAALITATAMPVLGQTANAYAIDLVYDVRVAGLRVFSAEGRLRVDGDLYAVEAVFKKEGIAAALSQTFSGRNRVTGQAAASGIQPRTGFSLIETASTRTWQVVYGTDGSFGENHAPVMQVRPERMVSGQQKLGAVDPLTAAVLGILRQDEPCNRTYPIFDSRRRFDVEMRRIGTAATGQNDAPSIAGEAVICEALTRKIAGYNPNDYDDAKANRNPPKLYLGHIRGVRGWYPYRLEMRAAFGDVVGRLSTVSIGPLSDADRAAMRQ